MCLPIPPTVERRSKGGLAVRRKTRHRHRSERFRGVMSDGRDKEIDLKIKIIKKRDPKDGQAPGTGGGLCTRAGQPTRSREDCNT